MMSAAVPDGLDPSARVTLQGSESLLWTGGKGWCGRGRGVVAVQERCIQVGSLLVGRGSIVGGLLGY